MTSIKVAVTQAEAICLDLAESLKKAVDLPAEAAAEGAGIIAFPELWGMLLIKRSMIKPTHVERTLFGEGSGDELTTTTELDFGAPLGRIKVSSMYFWEHTQPLLKHHTTSQGPVIHVSMWPPFDPNTGPEHPGLWNMTKEGCQKLSQTFLIGSAAYVLHATAVYSKKGIEVMNTQWGLACREPGGGHSCVIGRDGRVITEPSDGNADVKDLA